MLAFLARTGVITDLDDYLGSFTETAEAELEEALGDPSYFSPAKDFFMAGVEAGYEMTTAQGLSAWMGRASALLGSPLTVGTVRPPPAAVSRLSAEEQRARRKKRKSSRKSRRKNR